MWNFFNFTWDFNPTYSNVYDYKDDEETISICKDCKNRVKSILFHTMNRKESNESGMNGTIKYT
jgi:hypothetical protein